MDIGRVGSKVLIPPIYRLVILIAIAVTMFATIALLRTEVGSSVMVILFCLIATISGAVPLWALPILLIVVTPIVLLRFDTVYNPWSVLQGSLHPVLLVFACGLAFAVIAEEYGLDRRFIRFAVHASRGRYERFVFFVVLATVWLSAWISNVAAAGLIFAAVRPALDEVELDRSQKQCLLLAVAIAANLGGIITPVGTGANAVAIAAVAAQVSIGFIRWILFAAPLAIALIGLTIVAALMILRPSNQIATLLASPPPQALRAAVPVIFISTVVLWLLEPLHRIDAHWVSALSIVAMLVSGVLPLRRLKDLDWPVLLLITGGIGLGNLVQMSGLAESLVAPGANPDQRSAVMLFVFCAASALLAAVMSNTGTAAALIPIGLISIPAPSTAILIALATALGFPFVISTPANALAIRHGAKQSHFLLISMILILVGSWLLATTGKAVLSRVGIP